MHPIENGKWGGGSIKIKMISIDEYGFCRVFIVTNRADPDGMSLSAATYLGLHCLLMSNVKDPRYKSPSHLSPLKSPEPFC